MFCSYIYLDAIISGKWGVFFELNHFVGVVAFVW